jgi:hypothetical protein
VEVTNKNIALYFIKGRRCCAAYLDVDVAKAFEKVWNSA